VIIKASSLKGKQPKAGGRKPNQGREGKEEIHTFKKQFLLSKRKNKFLKSRCKPDNYKNGKKSTLTRGGNTFGFHQSRSNLWSKAIKGIILSLGITNFQKSYS